ncbi:MAG: hypothetical protein F7C32_02460 [Desulfurococcales archaeon]|nr:hypothetical protein [Desulfurococcales archaeon]
MVYDTIELVNMSAYMILAIGVIIPLTKIINLHETKLPYALTWISTIFMGIAACTLLNATAANTVTMFNGLVVYDKFSSFMLAITVISSALLLIAITGRAEKWSTSPAYYSLLALIQFGIIYAIGINDALLLLALWLLISVASYVVIALPKDRESVKGSVKYAFMGSLATLFLATWVAFQLFTTPRTASLAFELKAYTLTKTTLLAFGAFITALGFKLGITPFHWWLPDVYGKANGYGVALVGGIVKVAFIAIAARVLYIISAGPIGETVFYMLAAFAVASMLWGNIAALTTRNLQRILAYSSIAHIGYISVGFSVIAYASASGMQKLAMMALAATALHAAAYSISKTPLFAVLGEGFTDLNVLKGLYRRDPTAAVSIIILLLSLLGLPPLLGFWGKLYLFLAAAPVSMALVVIALINSGISALYYGIAIRDIISTEPGEAVYDDTRRGALVIAAALIIAIGLIAPVIFSLLT